jgi:hypothetical protein
MPQKLIEPSRVRLYEGGKRFTQIEKLQLIRAGLPVPTNTAFEPIVTRQFGALPKDVQAALMRSWLSTSTFFAKAKDGERMPEIIADNDTGITLIVPKMFVGSQGFGIAKNLTKDNFHMLVGKDGRTATIEISEDSLKFLALVAFCETGKANESTLWIPAKQVETGEAENRKFYFQDSRACLVDRCYDAAGYIRRYNVVLGGFRGGFSAIGSPTLYELPIVIPPSEKSALAVETLLNGEIDEKTARSAAKEILNRESNHNALIETLKEMAKTRHPHLNAVVNEIASNCFTGNLKCDEKGIPIAAESVSLKQLFQESGFVLTAEKLIAFLQAKDKRN